MPARGEFRDQYARVGARGAVVPTRSGRGEAVFIRAKLAKGRVYFAAVSSYRDGGGRVHHRSAALGREPDVGKALARAEVRVRALRAELRRLEVVYPEGAEPPAWAVRDRARLGRSLLVHEGRLARLREAKASLASVGTTAPGAGERPECWP